MGMLAMVNMLLLLVGFVMRLRKQRRARIQARKPILAITEPQQN